ncbi:hypothetical protein AB0N28_02990 [Streptomyces sp. NPDC051130]|uniref:hypothetical protein n=1 Tax=Streptomyces sp. NPDC051130 TaxID=3157223 RepID=UPI0034491BAF
MSIDRTLRSVVRAGAVPLLLMAAAAPLPAAAASGPDFQYVGQDDRVHGLSAPHGCVAAEGGGGRAVTNSGRATAALYREPRCAGAPVAVLRPGTVTPVRPYFASVRFSVTG